MKKKSKWSQNRFFRGEGALKTLPLLMSIPEAPYGMVNLLAVDLLEWHIITINAIIIKKMIEHPKRMTIRGNDMKSKPHSCLHNFN